MVTASFTSAIILGVQQHLAADSTLMEYMGNDVRRIQYGGFENQPVPCVTFIIVNAENDPTFEDDEVNGGEIQVDTYVPRVSGAAGCLRIAERIHSLLNRRSPACAGCHLKTQSLGFPIPEFEEDVWRCMEQFEFFAC